MDSSSLYPSHVFCLSKAQASIQSFLRPGLWLPGIRTPHLYCEVWELEEPPQQAFDEMLKSIKSVIDKDKEMMELREADEERLFIQLFSFTRKCNWLDVIEIQIDARLVQSDTTVSVKAFSTGIFPVALPLSFLWSALFCWIPFKDVGMNQRRVTAIRQAMNINCTVTTKGRTC